MTSSFPSLTPPNDSALPSFPLFSLPFSLPPLFSLPFFLSPFLSASLSPFPRISLSSFPQSLVFFPHFSTPSLPLSAPLVKFLGADVCGRRYYKLMNRIYHQEDQYLNLANSFHSMYQTPSVLEDATQWMPYLKSVVVYLVLAPHDNHQADFLARMLEDKKLDDLKPMKVLLTYFKTLEIIRWSALKELYSSELSQHEAFQGEKSAQRWEDLQKRVIQHNIRVVSGYYTDITMSRLSQLLELSDEQTEKHVCDMVVAGSMWCRIDRMTGVATFTPAKDPNETLNAWSNNISELLGKVEKMCHLIHKENMVHGNAK